MDAIWTRSDIDAADRAALETLELLGRTEVLCREEPNRYSLLCDGDLKEFGAPAACQVFAKVPNAILDWSMVPGQTLVVFPSSKHQEFGVTLRDYQAINAVGREQSATRVVTIVYLCFEMSDVLHFPVAEHYDTMETRSDEKGQWVKVTISLCDILKRATSMLRNRGVSDVVPCHVVVAEWTVDLLKDVVLNHDLRLWRVHPDAYRLAVGLVQAGPDAESKVTAE